MLKSEAFHAYSCPFLPEKSFKVMIQEIHKKNTDLKTFEVTLSPLRRKTLHILLEYYKVQHRNDVNKVVDELGIDLIRVVS